jgi:hypothetical protein
MPGPIDENQSLRPLMRDVLYFQARGETEQEIFARLEQRGHDPADIQTAWYEARRAKLFRENIESFDRGRTMGQLWDTYWLPVFIQSYGRRPTPAEESWARERPGDMLGLMAKVTVEGDADFRWTPTINVPWDATLEEIKSQVEDWFRANQPPSPKPGSVEHALIDGAKVIVELIGGALVPRIEPTLTLGR